MKFLSIWLCALFTFSFFTSNAQIQMMELQAADDATLQLQFQSNDTNQTNQIGTLNDGDLVFRANGTTGVETMRVVNENGYVGIGLAVPMTRLDVSGSITSSFNGYSSAFQFNGSNGVLSGLTFDGLDTRLYNDETDIGGGWVIIRANGGTSADVLMQAQNRLRFYTGSSLNQQMTITETGAVGIGTVNPSAELDVAGGVKVGNSSSTADGTIRYDGTNLQVLLGGSWLDICTGVCATTVDCNNFNVTFPAANQSFSQNFSITGSNQVVINIVFNTAVNTSTVVPGSTFLFTSGGSNIPGSLSWNGSNTVATFTTSGNYFSFCSFSPDCFMNLQLIGTDAGSGAIEDANGCNLDGDGNGTTGGNYNTTFGILG